MCLFTSSSDHVDVFWLGEAILVCPDGPRKPRGVELQVSGLARPVDANGGTLTFVHRGEIYGLEDRSSEWLADDDWYTDRVLRNPGVPGKGISRTGVDKVLIRCRQEMPGINAQVFRNGESSISDLAVFGDKTSNEYASQDVPKDPTGERALFSRFSIRLRQPVMQLFRIRFRTQFGITDYGNQIDMSIEGPGSAIEGIRVDIARHVQDPQRKEILRREIDRLFDCMLEPPYDISVIPHPSIAISVEGMQNAELPVSAPVESAGTPIHAAACPSRSLFFDMKRRDFLVRLVAQVTNRRAEYSPEFLDAIRKLGLASPRE